MRTVIALVFIGLSAAGLAAPKPKTPPKPATKPVPKPEVPAETRIDAQRLHDEALRAFRKGDLAAAQAGFQKVLLLAPDNVPALLNLALLEQRQRQYDPAAGHLRQVLRENPENASAWLLLGIGAYEQNKLDAAHAHLAQAVLYAPKNPQARQYLGVTLGRKGWYAAGEEELRRAIELDAKSADAHYNLAALYMERVPPAVELARRHYEIALRLGAAPDPELVKKIGD